MEKQKTLEDIYIPSDIIFSPDLNTSLSDNDIFIFPTILLANHYKKNLIQKNIPHNPDQITTLTDFCRTYHDTYGNKTRIINDTQALLILTNILDQIKTDIPFFFNQGNPSSGTLKDLYALRSIISQRSIDFASHPLVSTSEKCRQISRALASYEETLDKYHLLDSAALVKWTIQDISSKHGQLFSRVLIHRLYEIFPREKDLIFAIRNHAKTFRYEFLSGKDSDIFFSPDWLRPEELVLIEPTKEFDSRSDIFTTTPDNNTDEHVLTRVFSSTTEELESIAEEIHNLVEEGTPLEEIAISFPNISIILSQLQGVLDDFGVPSYAHVGEPLIREPIIGFLLLFPSLVLDVYPRESVLNLMSSPYFNIRQANLPSISVAMFDKVVRAAGIDSGYSWDEQLLNFKDHFENVKHSHPGRSDITDDDVDAVLSWITEIQKDFNQFTGNLTPSRYATIFRKLCMRWMRAEYITKRANHDDILQTREFLAYQQFQGCLSRLSSLYSGKDIFSLSQYQRFLIFLLEEPVNLTQDLGGVRIMGLRQTVGMEYSCLFIGGLVEGDIPYPSTRIPLLTSPESEQLGSRGLDEVIRGEQYYFISALSAGRKVWLSASKTRGERTILTSSFFEQVKWVKNSLQWGREIVHSQRRAAIRAGKSIRRSGGGGSDGYCPVDTLTWLSSDQTYGSVARRILIEDWFRTGTPDTIYDAILSQDDDVTTWLSDSRMFGPDRVWSPTQLETYAHCPFRFFLERVVRVNPLPEVDPTLSPAQKGTLIHETLYEFFTRWCAQGPRRVTNQDLEEAVDLITSIGSEINARYRYQSPVWHATIASLLGSDGHSGLYERFLLHEADREVLLRPEKFEFEIGSDQGNSDKKANYVVLESDEGEPVRIQGYIDRIDTTSDGQFAIIDYKTGSTYPNGKRIIEGKSLQLPLYLLALEKMYEGADKPKIGIGGSYLEISRKIKQSWPLLNPDKKQEAGVSTRAKGTPDFREVTKGSVTAAQQYIANIRRGIFHVTNEKCLNSTYCPYSGICRIDRFRVDESSDERGE
jgi:ATP-dependent helicase/DNAse subunit B